jgi:hypothetical protein
MSSTLSLRRMWTMHKKLLIEDGMSRRDQVLAQGAFYSGARDPPRRPGRSWTGGC